MISAHYRRFNYSVCAFLWKRYGAMIDREDTFQAAVLAAISRDAEIEKAFSSANTHSFPAFVYGFLRRHAEFHANNQVRKKLRAKPEAELTRSEEDRPLERLSSSCPPDQEDIAHLKQLARATGQVHPHEIGFEHGIIDKADAMEWLAAKRGLFQ